LLESLSVAQKRPEAIVDKTTKRFDATVLLASRYNLYLIEYATLASFPNLGWETLVSTPKNIILLSDGTGNAANRVWKSNVWRIFESLDLRGEKQIAFYDDGVGTSSFKPLAILGGAFGWGLKRNVLDIYKFVCVNYKPGDKIYGFGFSRGAFTMRVVIGLILNQGLVTGNT
jgi:uncharacterized protein (DUF2235 family)